MGLQENNAFNVQLCLNPSALWTCVRNKVTGGVTDKWIKVIFETVAGCYDFKKKIEAIINNKEYKVVKINQNGKEKK